MEKNALDRSKRQFFGTDGIRGKANVYPMTCETALKLGRAVTYYFQSRRHMQHPLIVISKDTRLSCYMLEQAFSAGVCSQGGRAILTGPMPTPGAAFVTKSMRALAGVMISASHNHFGDNGIKLFDSMGQKLPDEVEWELEQLLLHPERIPVVLDHQLGRATRLDEAVGRYVVHVKSTFPDHYTLEGMKLVVDSANGAAYKVAPMIFKELGAEVISIGTEPNGSNINVGGSTAPEICQEKVLQHGAHMGICLDGDADRLLVINRRGEIVPGDVVLGITAKYLGDREELGDAKEVVGTVMTNLGLEHYLRNFGISVVRTQVGDRYIFDYMRGSTAVLGGEPSGHLIFKRFSTTGDGMVAALKVLEAICYFAKPLEELQQEITLYPQVHANVTVTERPEFSSVPEIEKAMKEARNLLGAEGRVLLRYSGTEPLARIMLEGPHVETLNQCKFILQSAVEHALNPQLPN